VGFVVDKVRLGQVFSEYFGLPCKFSFRRLLHNHHLSSEHNHHLSSEAGTVSTQSHHAQRNKKIKKIHLLSRQSHGGVRNARHVVEMGQNTHLHWGNLYESCEIRYENIRVVACKIISWLELHLSLLNLRILLLPIGR
jgi:hypothetical protein